MNEEAAVTEVPADSLLAEAAKPMDFTAGKPEGFPDDFCDAE